MPRNVTKTSGERKSRARILLRIILLLADDYRPADGMSMAEILGIARNHLIKTALKETGGNATAAGKILGINRTTLVEHFRRGGLPDREFFRRRRKRWSERTADGSEPTGRDEEE